MYRYAVFQNFIFFTFRLQLKNLSNLVKSFAGFMQIVNSKYFGKCGYFSSDEHFVLFLLKCGFY